MILKILYTFLLTSIINMYSADLDSISANDLRQETGKQYLKFTLFGGSSTNAGAFNQLYSQAPGLQARFFDAPNTFKPQRKREESLRSIGEYKQKNTDIKEKISKYAIGMEKYPKDSNDFEKSN